MDDTQGFLRLIRPCWQRLHAVARRYCVRAEDAADLVQETLLRAWRAYSPTQAASYRPAWLFVILRNIVIDWMRVAQKRVALVPIPVSELTELAPTELSDPLAPLSAMDETRFREFLDEKVVEAFDALDAPFREVVVLSVAGDLTYREIAEVLDCPIGTVMSRMARARRTLRERLAEHCRVEYGIREVRP